MNKIKENLGLIAGLGAFIMFNVVFVVLVVFAELSYFVWSFTYVIKDIWEWTFAVYYGLEVPSDNQLYVAMFAVFILKYLFYKHDYNKFEKSLLKNEKKAAEKEKIKQEELKEINSELDEDARKRIEKRIEEKKAKDSLKEVKRKWKAFGLYVFTIVFAPWLLLTVLYGLKYIFM